MLLTATMGPFHRLGTHGWGVVCVTELGQVAEEAALSKVGSPGSTEAWRWGKKHLKGILSSSPLMTQAGDSEVCGHTEAERGGEHSE